LSVDLSSKIRSQYRLQQYGPAAAIDGLVISPLRRFYDDGGSMVEIARLAGGAPLGIEDFQMAQVNYSCLQPGVVKAFHVHRRQTDLWFVPPEDRVLFVAVDVRAGSPTESHRVRVLLGDGHAQLVRIPPGVAHGCRNVGDRPGRLLYFTDLHFSPDPRECDEGRLPWDLIGAQVRDVAWDRGRRSVHRCSRAGPDGRAPRAAGPHARQPGSAAAARAR
jgi:dTDP-4-dehydrorhamnose 3,5-epimerase